MDEHTIEISGSTVRHSPDETSALGKGESGSVSNGIYCFDYVPITENKPSSDRAAAQPEQLAADHTNGKPELTPAADNAPDGGEITNMHGRKESKPAAEMKIRYLTRERQRGEFHRFFPFINAINEKEVTASFHNGILHVTVPKGPATKKNDVEIHYGGV